eukprot:COSAG02_NODE_20060_length_850_cov_1.033289_1_plen_53_part_10
MSRVWCAASGWEREGEFACIELAIHLHYYSLSAAAAAQSSLTLYMFRYSESSR